MLPIKDHEPSGIIPVLNIGIILLTIAVFFVEYTAPDVQAFILRWGLVPADVPQVWHGFFTAMFLHGGFLHIASNMWFLFIFGDNVEAALGKIGYAFLYVTGGIVAGAVQYMVQTDSVIPIVGASGAIAAVLGLYMVRFPKHTITTLVPMGTASRLVQLPSTAVLGLWFVTQIFNGTASLATVQASTGGGVAWWAHAGGFAFGALVGVCTKKRPLNLQ